MQALIDQLVLFIQNNQAWAGFVIFLMTFGESLFVVGLFIPATVLLFATGTLMATGTLDSGTILIWGVIGAIVGDALSFWLGRWMGPKVLRHKHLNPYRRKVARARLFFYRYGFFAVLIARFLGPLRCFIPTVAGVMGMPELRFQLANIISAILWLPALLAPGYLATRGVEAIKDGNHATVYSLVGLTVIGIITWLVIRQRRAIEERKAASRRRHRS
ncbi:DedA family protein [Zwartia panacis]|uniref:DedA family protein n=1 Tax=Zwartia panacis TaxID=2683345 RepID=UPI0025B5DDA1|nr:DedA family protein [Zwartia panacis]MDN4016936.1 DedA family protein [Zwartia panacis]